MNRSKKTAAVKEVWIWTEAGTIMRVTASSQSNKVVGAFEEAETTLRICCPEALRCGGRSFLSVKELEKHVTLKHPERARQLLIT